MDMLYQLPFRDWMELNKAGGRAPAPPAAIEDPALAEVAARAGGGLSRGR
jgi:hypothetical protein